RQATQRESCKARQRSDGDRACKTPLDIRPMFTPVRGYSAAAGRANSVENAYGTRMCAILDVSPQRLASSGCGFLTTTCSFPASANFPGVSTKRSFVALSTIVGTASPLTYATERLTKLTPVRVTVVSGEPCITVRGAIA